MLFRSLQGKSNIQILNTPGQTKKQINEWIERIRSNPNAKITVDAFSGSIGSLKKAWRTLTEEERKRITINASGIQYEGKPLATADDFPGSAGFKEHLDSKSGHYGHYKDRNKSLQEQQAQQAAQQAAPAAAPAPPVVPVSPAASTGLTPEIGRAHV